MGGPPIGTISMDLAVCSCKKKIGFLCSKCIWFKGTVFTVQPKSTVDIGSDPFEH